MSRPWLAKLRLLLACAALVFAGTGASRAESRVDPIAWVVQAFEATRASLGVDQETVRASSREHLARASARDDRPRRASSPPETQVAHLPVASILLRDGALLC